MSKNNHKKIPKKATFWSVFWFIVKISFIGFGGGNALFPIIRSEAVMKNNWISDKQLEEIIVVTNSLPGASVPETISYISVQLLGKFKGLLVTYLALIPHILIFFVIFIIGIKYIPTYYLNIIYVAVIPVIIAMLIGMIIKYIKSSAKELTLPVLSLLFLFSFSFNLLVPAPYNIPAIAIVGILLLSIIIVFIKNKKNKNLINPTLVWFIPLFSQNILHNRFGVSWKWAC